MICARQLLNRDGVLVFSTNAQRFKLDAAISERHDVADISRATIPLDYERNPPHSPLFRNPPRAD